MCVRVFGKGCVSLGECVRPCGVELLNLWNLFVFVLWGGRPGSVGPGPETGQPWKPAEPPPSRGALGGNLAWASARLGWGGGGGQSSGLEGQLALCQGSFNLAGCGTKGQSGERQFPLSPPQLGPQVSGLGSPGARPKGQALLRTRTASLESVGLMAAVPFIMHPQLPWAHSLKCPLCLGSRLE